jgi:hypothetical protein
MLNKLVRHPLGSMDVDKPDVEAVQEESWSGLSDFDEIR